jgi:hypothetical protein
MANWKSKIDVSDLMEKYHDDELALTALSKGVAERVRANKFAKEKDSSTGERLETIALGFDDIDDDEDEDGFDYWLEQLYNLGDFDHLIWIKT